MPRVYHPRHQHPEDVVDEHEHIRRAELAARAAKRRTASAVLQMLGARVEVEDQTGFGGRRGTVIGGSNGFLHVCFDDHSESLETAAARGDGYVAHVAVEDVSAVGSDDPENVEFEMGLDYADDDAAEDLVATACGRSFRVPQELPFADAATRAAVRARNARGQGVLTLDFRGAYSGPKARQAAAERQQRVGGPRLLGARLRGINEKHARERADAEARGVLAQAEATLRECGVHLRVPAVPGGAGRARAAAVARHGDTALLRWVLLWRADGVDLRLSVRTPEGALVCEEATGAGALEHDGGSRGVRGGALRPEPLKVRGWFAESISVSGTAPSVEALPGGAYTAAVTYVADAHARRYDDDGHSGDEASVLSGHGPATAVEWRLVFVSRTGEHRCELRHGILELPGDCATGPEMAWEYAAPRSSTAVTGDDCAPDPSEFAAERRGVRNFENFSNVNDYF